MTQRVLTIKAEGKRYVADDLSLLGSPPVGRGKSMEEAIGNWLINNQVALGIYIEVHPSAQEGENKRRKKALKER